MFKKLSSLGKGAVSIATSKSQNFTDKALGAAISQLMSTLRYASQKIVEADEDLPKGTILRVTASALLVEIALEVPVKEIINGQDCSRGSDEVVREEVRTPSDADDSGSSES